MRVHYQDALSDLFAIKFLKSWSLSQALQYMSTQVSGVVVLLSHQGSTDHVLKRLKGMPHAKPGEHMPSIRMLGTGARILLQLGVRKMNVLSPPKRLHGLSGFGLEVQEYIEELPQVETCV